jgi:hypothetical protein
MKRVIPSISRFDVTFIFDKPRFRGRDRMISMVLGMDQRTGRRRYSSAVKERDARCFVRRLVKSVSGTYLVTRRPDGPLHLLEEHRHHGMRVVLRGLTC